MYNHYILNMYFYIWNEITYKGISIYLSGVKSEFQ